MKLFRGHGFLLGTWGLYGFADIGRVYVDGESPGGWHTGFGGGLWLQMLGRPMTGRVGVGVGKERTLIYISLGMAF